MANMKDVAKLAGVSISTVSNVLNDSRYVSETTRAKVMAAVDELYYEVDYIASSMKSNRTKILGVVVPSISRIFFPEVISGMQDAADKLGYHLLVYSTGDSFDKEKAIIQTLANLKVDGIILDSMAKIEQEANYFRYLANLHSGKKKIPVVHLEFDVTKYGIDSVFVDNFAGAMLSTQKLIDHGARRIAFIAIGRIRMRMEGYIRTLQINGIPVDKGLIYAGGTTPMGGFRSVEALLSNGVKFDAIFAGNDQTAIGAMKALMSKGLKVPQDVLITGFDNIFISSIISPALTTVDVPKNDMGYKVCELLVERIEKSEENTPPKSIELPIRLIERASTDSNKETKWMLENW